MLCLWNFSDLSGYRKSYQNIPLYVNNTVKKDPVTPFKSNYLFLSKMVFSQLTE